MQPPSYSPIFKCKSALQAIRTIAVSQRSFVNRFTLSNGEPRFKIMKRRAFVKVAGLSAFAAASSGFELIDTDGAFSTDCAASTDMLGPFFRKEAPFRNDLTDSSNKEDIPIRVVSQVLGADCKTPLKNVEIDIWHCDHKKEYDMDLPAYTCRGKVTTNESGEYWFKTFMPPPYGGRPKHIHYLIDGVEGYRRLATQLYFKGDNKIKPNNWVKCPWDDRRILEVYTNDDGLAEVMLDLYLRATATD